MKRNSSEAIGWVGVAFILCAYALVTFELLPTHSFMYSFLNLLGSLGIIVSSYVKRDYQPILLNSAWLIVATFGIIRSFL